MSLPPHGPNGRRGVFCLSLPLDVLVRKIAIVLLQVAQFDIVDEFPMPGSVTDKGTEYLHLEGNGSIASLLDGAE